MVSKDPAIIYIRKSDKEHFSRLEEKDSPFGNKGKKHLFLAAMVVGFKNGIKHKITDRDPPGYIRTEYLSDTEKALINAVAVKDAGNLEVLLDKKRVYSIAEEYAAGGIKILKDQVFSGKGSFSKRLETELIGIAKKVKKK